MDVFVACFHIIYACNGSSGIDGRHFFRIGYKLSLTVDGHPSVAAVGNVQHTVIGGSCFGVGQLGCIQHFTAIAEGEKESAILRAEAKKEAQIKIAEGEAEALVKTKQAEAEGIKLLKEAGADKAVLTLKSFEALSNVANGQSTKIIVPSELQNIATLGTTIKEMMKEDK